MCICNVYVRVYIHSHTTHTHVRVKVYRALTVHPAMCSAPFNEFFSIKFVSICCYTNMFWVVFSSHIFFLFNLKKPGSI